MKLFYIELEIYYVGDVCVKFSTTEYIRGLSTILKVNLPKGFN